RPARDHRLDLDARSGAPRTLDVATRVTGTGHDATEVPRAEALVVAMARDSARLRLPLEHEHIADAEPAQLDRACKPRRTAADNHDLGAGGRHRRPACSASSAETCAPQ